MKTRVTLVRHGLTNENLTFTMIGITDPPLHPLGHEVLERVGERLRTEVFDRAYASPLTRAIQSAKEITKYHSNLDLVIEPRLAEINLGVWEGRLSSEVFANRDTDPIVQDALNEDLEDFRVPGGEGRREALDRFKVALESITAKDPGGNILVVTHGGLLALLHCEFNKEALGRFRYHHPKHGSLSVVELTTSEIEEGSPKLDTSASRIDGARIEFITYDDQAHIDEDLDERIKVTAAAMRRR